MQPTVLILCTGNSCRSQMAEGLLRAAAGDAIHVVSAGSKPAGHLNARAVQVLREIGLDLSGHRSKSLDEFRHQKIDTVITVCSHADQACPVFPGQVNRHHWGFEDPHHTQGTEEEIMAAFRRTRDQIALVFGAYAAGLREGAAFHQPAPGVPRP
jgi:arsenate reductase (thioredoxin)